MRDALVNSDWAAETSVSKYRGSASDESDDRCCRVLVRALHAVHWVMRRESRYAACIAMRRACGTRSGRPIGREASFSDSDERQFEDEKHDVGVSRGSIHCANATRSVPQLLVVDTRVRRDMARERRCDAAERVTTGSCFEPQWL